jgi:tetratricopeptide (TPR) repeat protein
VLQERGDLDGAQAAFERALRIDEAARGADHPDIACDVNNLGSVLRARCDLDGAQAAFERPLRIDEAAYDADHPSVACDVNNLGSVLRARCDLDGAQAPFERARRSCWWRLEPVILQLPPCGPISRPCWAADPPSQRGAASGISIDTLTVLSRDFAAERRLGVP